MSALHETELKLPTAADVADAARMLEGVAARTPLITSAALDRATGARVFLKAEIFQHTGSFKFRGAYNRIARIPPERRAAGVVAFSSGNHAQGVAAAAKILGLAATIVMPADVPALKRERTMALGAEVVLYDRERENRDVVAAGVARQLGATLVPPYDDPYVIAGQGTVGREIVEDLASMQLAPEIVLVPASGGGLVSGIALSVKERHPQARVLTVEPQGFDDHARSFRAGKRERNPRASGSICDALLVGEPGRLTFEITRKLVGEGLSVSDEQVREAMRFAFRELKVVVEPGGAVALAAALAGGIDLKGKVAVLVLSGGNVDAELFASVIGGI
jgi:threonine dehydratase